MIVGARKERVREKSRDRHDSSTNRLISCTLLGFACENVEKSFRKEKKEKYRRERERKEVREESVASRGRRKKKGVFCVYCVDVCRVLSRVSIKRWIL